MVGNPAIVVPVGCGLFMYHFALGCYPYLQQAIKPLFAKKK